MRYELMQFKRLMTGRATLSNIEKSLVEDDLNITVSADGEAAGTPAYMSPEQTEGKEATQDSNCNHPIYF